MNFILNITDPDGTYRENVNWGTIKPKIGYKYWHPYTDSYVEIIGISQDLSEVVLDFCEETLCPECRRPWRECGGRCQGMPPMQFWV